MRMRIVVFLVFVGAGCARSQEPVTPWMVDVSAGYKGIHLTGYSLHTSVTYDGMFTLDGGYGFDFLNSVTFGGRVQLNRGPNQFSLFAGYGLFFHKEPSDYNIRIRSIHTGISYQSVFGTHFVIGQSVTVVKYLDERFSIPNYKVRQVFDASESNYFELGISVGFRFALDELF